MRNRAMFLINGCSIHVASASTCTCMMQNILLFQHCVLLACTVQDNHIWSILYWKAVNCSQRYMYMYFILHYTPVHVCTCRGCQEHYCHLPSDFSNLCFVPMNDHWSWTCFPAKRLDSLIKAFCKLSNIIYLITCKRCGQQYLGEMGQPLQLGSMVTNLKDWRVSCAGTFKKWATHPNGHYVIVNAWACMRYRKYNEGSMIAHTCPCINKFITRGNRKMNADQDA